MLVKNKEIQTIILGGCLVFFLLIGPFVQAQVTADSSLGFDLAAQIGSGALGTNSLEETVISVVNIALGFLGLLAVLIIMYGGFVWMTAGGRQDRIDQAKKILRNGVIGLAIILSSWGIAAFFFRAFSGSIFGSGTPPVGGGGIGSGALGAGIIESIYPPPGATDVPRNTQIYITFKESMDPDSLINGGAIGTLFEVGGVPVVQIQDTTTPLPILAGAMVAVATNNNRTFVFDPFDPLGNSISNTSYVVSLTNDIKKADGSPAFGTLSGIGFSWSFTVSNLIDATPPQIQAVQPRPDSVNPRNVILSVRFSEAINPLSIILGTTMTVNGGSGAVAGELFQSGDYRTIDFLPAAVCEGQPLNTCGEQVFCLPGNDTIATRFIAEDLVPGPITGLQDASGNSLDGNRDGIAAGPGTNDFNLGAEDLAHGDNVIWNFTTNNTIDLRPPLVVERSPNSGDSDASLTAALMIKMDKQLSMSTLKPDGSYGNGREYVTLVDPSKKIGYWVSGTNGNGCSASCLNEGSDSVFTALCSNSVRETGEDCDDGNTVSGDGCSNNCLNEGTGRCGDGLITHAEECDDSNVVSGDGCSSICQLEGTSACASITASNCCGNGLLESGEGCDNTSDLGCGSSCLRIGVPGGSCGDGRIQFDLGENCDDSNVVSGDGCSNVCRREGAKCGNGTIQIGEDCDNTSGTCSNFCLNIGTAEPVCGNNIQTMGEDCDLGPAANEAFIFISHTPFNAGGEYGVRLGSGIRDSFQNCFLPSGTISGPPTGQCPIVVAPGSPIGFGPGATWSGTFPNCELP